MLQPHVPKQGVVSLLVQKQLPVSSEAWVDFAVLVEIGGVGPAAIAVMEVEDGAFADVDEEADFVAASIVKGVGR